MRIFYEEWSAYVNRQPIADDLEVNGEGFLLAICQPMSGEINWNEFISLDLLITWKFSNTLSDRQFAIKATKAFKDNYLLDFINTENLGEAFDDIASAKLLRNN